MNLKKLTKLQLKQIIVFKDLKGYSRLNKPELITLIKKNIKNKELLKIIELFNFNIIEKNVYHLTNRPVMVGTYPSSNMINIERFTPTVILKKFPYIRTHGRLTYSNKLTFKQIYDYELTPENKKEYAKYGFWIRSNKNTEKAKQMEKMYKKQKLKDLIEHKNDDPYAYLTLLLKGKE